jgi:predicted metalloendopeptidase
MRFGALGAAIGHELTHGFDAQGALFDADGRAAPWWSEATTRGFAAAAQCLIDQYDAFEVLPGLRGNGRLALGENAADLGGVALAHRAWRAHAAHGEDAASAGLAGLSAEQLFFVAYAQTWCAKGSPEFDARQVQRDPRGRPRFRADGPLANLPAFREAFACPAGAPMSHEPACRIW